MSHTGMLHLPPPRLCANGRLQQMRDAESSYWRNKVPTALSFGHGVRQAPRPCPVRSSSSITARLHL
ncbi:hypothetical protein AAFF_G00381530 [Aldrovandia affinis]|uniref:Uncharacterized protein n=1 Tax=Aldrovandia affinis TaxID=143900 RepID=A0AAD7T819_9TELE|nr:hypothetical protein AAFF_G00381530 [Aldrovandia affinis]